MTKDELLQIKDIIADAVEPINQKLEELDQRTARTESKLEELDQKATRTESKLEELDSIKTKLEELDQKATRTALQLENETNRAVKATMEGYAILNQKMDSVLNVVDRVETLEHKVSAIEFYIKRQQK